MKRLVVLAAALTLAPGVFTGAAELTAAQRASVDKLVGSIKRLSRSAYANEMWQAFAALYNPDTLVCDPPWETNGAYSYLSMPGIPDSAGYRVGPISEFHMAGVDTSKMGATHYIEISYQWQWLEKCGKPNARVFPRVHFYLRPAADGFELAHYCRGSLNPPPPGMPKRAPPMVSAKWAATFVGGLSAAERQQLRRSIVDVSFPLNALFAMQDRYGISEPQAEVAIEKLCEIEGAQQAP